MPTPTQPRYLSPVEKARQLGVHKLTLARWRRLGIGPRYLQAEHGGAIRYLAEDNEADLNLSKRARRR